jgi:hypothetical protein
VKSILDPTFKYVPSHATNIRETFAELRRQRLAQAVAQLQAEDRAPLPLNVLPIVRRRVK